jgi:hypothetical protein
MSGSDRFNTAAAVFAHNILASKGINTTTMASLNRALDDNLNAQLQNMEKKGRVAGQFKQVYDAVRSESESEAEARMKMRGLMLQEFRAGVTAKLSSMDSDYAKIKAQEIYTGIEQQLVKDMTELRQVYRQNYERERAYNSDLMYKEAQLRLEKSADARAWRAQKFNEKQIEEANKPTAPQWDPTLTVRDPAGIEGPEGQATPIGHARKEEVEELNKSLNNQYQMAKKVKRLGELSRELGNIYSSVGKNAFLTEHKAELISLREDMVTAKKREMSGLAATDQEQKVYGQIIGEIDNWTKGALGGDSTTMMHTASQTALRDLRLARYNLGTRLTYPGDTSGKGVKINDVPGIFESEAELKAAKAKPPERTKTEERLGEIEGPGAWEDKKVSPDSELSKSYFSVAHPGKSKAFKGSDVADHRKTVPQWAAAMYDTFETAKNRSVDSRERGIAAHILSEFATDDTPNQAKKGFKMGDWEAKRKYARALYEGLLSDGAIDIYGNVQTDSIDGVDETVVDENY